MSFSFLTSNTSLSGQVIDFRVTYQVDNSLHTSSSIKFQIAFLSQTGSITINLPELTSDLPSSVIIEAAETEQIEIPGLTMKFSEGNPDEVRSIEVDFGSIKKLSTWKESKNPWESLGAITIENLGGVSGLDDDSSRVWLEDSSPFATSLNSEATIARNETIKLEVTLVSGGSATFELLVQLEGGGDQFDPSSLWQVSTNEKKAEAKKPLTLEGKPVSKKGKVFIEFSQPLDFSNSFFFANSDMTQIVQDSLRVELLHEPEDDPQAAATMEKLLSFSWQVVEVASTGVRLEIEFENPLYVSQSRFDFLEVTLEDSSWITSSQAFTVEPGLGVKMKIPKQEANMASGVQMMTDPETIQASVEGSKSLMSSNFLLSIALGLSLQRMWSAINAMQIIFLMGLVEIRHQANLEQYFSVLSEYLQLELYEREAPASTNNPEQLEYERENERKVSYGYTSSQILFNSFSLSVGLLLNFGAALLGRLIKAQCPIGTVRSKKLSEVQSLLRGRLSFVREVQFTPIEKYTLQLFIEEEKTKLQNLKEWFFASFVDSAYQRTIIEGTAEVVLCSLVDIIYFWRFQARANQWEIGRLASFSCSLIFLILTLCFLIQMRSIIRKAHKLKTSHFSLSGFDPTGFELGLAFRTEENRRKMEARRRAISASQFLQENESVIANLNPRSVWALSFNSIFILRRVVLVLVLLFASFNKFLQIHLFTHLSLALLLYLIAHRPFIDRGLMRMEFVNEAMTLAASYFFVMLNAISEQGIQLPSSGDSLPDLVIGDPEQEASVANLIIQLLFVQFGINMVFVASHSVQESIASCIKSRRKTKFNSHLRSLFCEFEKLTATDQELRDSALYLKVPYQPRLGSFEQFYLKKQQQSTVANQDRKIQKANPRLPTSDEAQGKTTPNYTSKPAQPLKASSSSAEQVMSNTKFPEPVNWPLEYAPPVVKHQKESKKNRKRQVPSAAVTQNTREELAIMKPFRARNDLRGLLLDP